VNVTKQEVSEYDKVIEALFFKKFNEAKNPDITEIDFVKDDLIDVAKSMNITIRNFPDVTYTYRSRGKLPDSVCAKGNWIIKQKGKSNYAFIKSKRSPFIAIQEGLAPTEISNSLPEIVEKYIAEDEQGLLSAIRYNRLIDIFTGITCFHLQSHIRTTIDGEGQVEIDDLYVGIDHDGKEFILPLEAKSADARDKLGWVQVTNLVKFAHQNFPNLKCRPICAKPIDINNIYLIEFEDKTDFDDIGIKDIQLYRLLRTI
jgi:hypothetical protein